MPTSVLALLGGAPVRTESFPAWPVWDDRDRRVLLEVLESGAWGRIDGTRVDAFEAAFARFQGSTHAVAVVNGSVALRLALLSVGVEAGDEVIVPPYTFMATATAVIEANAVPVFADIDADTFCLDPAAFEAAVTPRTRAVIPVHVGGIAADMARICAIAARHDIAVIEDAAHAHGGCSGGRGLGTIGHMGCFSFQSTKNLTCGEGGAVVSGDPVLAQRCWSLHNCGRAPGGAWYGHPTLGMNYRLGEFQAGLLLSQLERLPEQTARRDANGRHLSAQLAAVPGIEPTARPGPHDVCPHHLYPFRYRAEAFAGVSRERFLRALRAEGIPAAPGYTTPLYRQGLFTDRAVGPYTGGRDTGAYPDYSRVRCPVCERVSEAEGAWLSQRIMLGPRGDMDDIAEAVAKVHANREALAAASLRD